MKINELNYYISIILLTIIFSSCNSSGYTTLNISNETSDTIYIDCTKTSNPVDTIVSIPIMKGRTFAISIYEEYNKKNIEIEVKSEISKIVIFKIADKDTIYLPLETYNKVDKLEASYDFGYSSIYYYLTITDSMFEK